MATTANPFVLRDTNLLMSPVGGTGTEYRCQLTQAQLTPSTAAGGGGGLTLSTFCQDYTDTASTNASWTLDLAGFQAYQDALDLSIILFRDEGLIYDFTLVPNEQAGPISPTNPGFQGQVTIVPTQIGGTAAQYATFTVSLNCKAKPTMLTAPFVAIAGVTAGSPGAFTPAGSTPPADLASLKAHAVVGDAGTAKPATAWTTGQYVVLGDASESNWDGTAWAAGQAALAADPASRRVPASA